MCKQLLTSLFILTTLTWAMSQNPQSANPVNTRDQSNLDHIGRGLDRGFSIEEVERKALAAYDDEDYRSAMHLYQVVLEADSNRRATALRGYADAARNLVALTIADSAYQVLVAHNLPGTDGGTWFGLAETQFRQGHYEEAAASYEKFLSLPESQEAPKEMRDEARLHLKSCRWVLEEGDNLNDPTAEVTMLDTNISKPYFAEYSPRPVGDRLYFSAYRFPLDKDKYGRESHIVKILSATTDNYERVGVDTLTINEKKRHTMHVTFDRSGNRIFYTVADFAEKSKIRIENQALYSRRKLPDGRWSEPVRLPNNINLPGYIATEPAVGWQEGKSEEVLFFVSDRPGGKGGKDIWASRILGDSFSAPINLDTFINTAGNDVTPYYAPKKGVLYYSTDGRRTIGGFDIWESKGYWAKWDTSSHLKAPINSPANDVFFASATDGSVGYFSSNRFGSTNNEEDGCCYDIFETPLLKPRLLVKTYNCGTGDSLPGVTLRLYEVTPSGPKQIAETTPDGSFTTFELATSKTYFVTGEKEGFDKASTDTFSTPDRVWPELLLKELCLNPHTVKLIVRVFDEKSRQPIYGATARFFDYNLKPLTPRDTIDPESNEYKYNLEYEHTYRVFASKKGFTSDSTDLISTVGVKGNRVFIDSVYLGDNLPEFLPLDVYFDNDKPRPDPGQPVTNQTTSLVYEKTNFPYFARRDTFVKVYTKGLTGAAFAKAQAEMDSFFYQKVRGGRERLKEFTEALEYRLGQGDHIEIKVSGHASPLAKPEYNAWLTGRRIYCVMNHFRIQDGGILKKYFDNGQLVVTEDPAGERDSAKGVSDNPRDQKNSIYSIRASLERRVQITKLEVKTRDIGSNK